MNQTTSKNSDGRIRPSRRMTKKELEELKARFEELYTGLGNARSVPLFTGDYKTHFFRNKNGKKNN